MRARSQWIIGTIAAFSVGALVALALLDSAPSLQHQIADERSRSTDERTQSFTIDAPLSPEPDSRLEIANTPAPSQATERQSIFGARTVVIRSSTGLALDSVEIADASGLWHETELRAGLLALASTSGSLSIRAPGHRPAVLTPLATELDLVPDAQIAIEGEALASRVSALDYSDDSRRRQRRKRSELSKVVLAGYSSDERWVAAIQAPSSDDVKLEAAHGTWDARPAPPRPPEANDDWIAALKVELTLVDGRSVELEYTPTPGARDVWHVDTISVEQAPLTIHVVGLPAGSEDEIETELFDAAKNRFGDVTKHSWGWVQIDPVENRRNVRTWRPGTSTLDLGSLPLGRRYGVIVRVAGDSAYGQSFFDHDGAEQRVALHQGLSITGMLRAPSGARLPPDAQFAWIRRHPTEAGPTFRASSSSVLIDANGRFTLKGPLVLSQDEDDLTRFPSHIELMIDASGFPSWIGDFDAGDARHFDCGIIDLELAQVGRPPGIDGGARRSRVGDLGPR